MEPGVHDIKVFYRLRVSADKPGHRTDDGPRTHVLYNGVSANSWLQPLGMGHRKDQSMPTKSLTVHDECRRTVIERARSAGAMLGRRHFETNRQTLGEEEVVQGVNIGFKREDTSVAKAAVRPESNRVRFSDRAVPLFQKNKDQCLKRELLIVKQRPKTAPSNLLVPKENGKKKEQLFDKLSITGIRRSSNPTETDTTSEKPRSTEKIHADKRDDEKDENSRQDDSKPDFKTLKEMSAAYNACLENFPYPLGMLGYQVVNPVGTAGSRLSNAQSVRLKQRQEDAPPRSITPRNRFEKQDKVHMERPISSLKPLLFNEDNVVKHGSGCPYRCKGCFSACLISEDYIEQSERQGVQSTKGETMDSQKKKVKRTAMNTRAKWGVKSSRRPVKELLREFPEPQLSEQPVFTVRTLRRRDLLEEADGAQDLEEHKSVPGPCLKNSVQPKGYRPAVVLAIKIKEAKLKLGPSKASETLTIQGACLLETPEQRSHANIDFTPNTQETVSENFRVTSNGQVLDVTGVAPGTVQATTQSDLEIAGSCKPQHSRYELD